MTGTELACYSDPQYKACNDLIGQWVLITAEPPEGPKSYILASHQGISWGSLYLNPLNVLDRVPMESADIPTEGWTAHTALSRGQIYMHTEGHLLRDDDGVKYTIERAPEHLDECCRVSSVTIDDARQPGSGPTTNWAHMLRL